MLLMLMRGALCRVEELGYESVGVDGDGELAGEECHSGNGP